MAMPPLSSVAGQLQASLPWLPTDHLRRTAKSTSSNQPRTRARPRRLLAASCRVLEATNPTKLIQESDADVQIRRSCRLGDLTQALRLLGLGRVAPESYCAVLQLCAELNDLEGGKRAHFLISSSDIGIDGVLGSELVFMYIKCGDLLEARKVFDEMAQKNVYVWNLLMSGYAKAGDFQESFLLLKQMCGSGIMPDAYSISCALKCAAGLPSIRDGEMVHGYLVKLDLGVQCAVGNALIALYSKSSRIEDALQVFDRMPQKNVISWNSVISGCSSNGLNTRAVELFARMWDGGNEMDSVTMVSILPSCAELGYGFVGRAVHGYAIKAGFMREVNLANALLAMYSKCSDLHSAFQMFQKTDQKNVVSWTAMITTYTQAGLFDDAIMLFREMMKLDSIKADVFAITCALHACADKGSLEHGTYVHDCAIRIGMEKDVSIANALMEMYTKCGDMGQARSVFDGAASKDIISWNTLLGGYSRSNCPNEAFSLFSEMQLHLRPNAVTMTCVLPAAASLSSLERGREMHAYAIRRGYSEDVYVANAIVDMYIKCGALLLARRLFDRMVTKELILWTIMIAGYGMHGHGGDAIAVFEEMRGAGVEPDEASFTAILYACCHTGLTYTGWTFFNTMRNDYKIQPKLKHYACMVDLLSRSGRLAGAYRFIESMPIVPDPSIWGTLLRACRFHRDVKFAERVAERLFQLEPENTGHYVLLANIYAEAEKWEAVKKLQKKIGVGRELRGIPASSWIEIKGKVHVFAAGDQNHPQSKRIAEFLDKVARKMRDEGNDSKRKFALIDANDVVKVEAFCGHSEKLAIAFGVLNSSEGRPIRVAKNSRVCGDCHEVAKFISKTCSVEIILRDTKRFHHFEEGRCCCRGYW